MKREDVHILRKETVFKGYFQVDRYDLTHKTFGGAEGKPVRREVFERGHAVGVILFDPGHDAVVLIEQFRIGAHAGLEQPWFGPEQSPWLLEIVAGIIEDGETPIDVARRESEEEAGCRVEDLFEVMTFFATPGASTESLIIYCGRIDSTTADGIHGLEEEGEDIKVHVVPCEEVWRWLDSGRFTNATALVALQWLRIHHDEVKARWGF